MRRKPVDSLNYCFAVRRAVQRPIAKLLDALVEIFGNSRNLAFVDAIDAQHLHEFAHASRTDAGYVALCDDLVQRPLDSHPRLEQPLRFVNEVPSPNRFSLTAL